MGCAPLLRARPVRATGQHPRARLSAGFACRQCRPGRAFLSFLQRGGRAQVMYASGQRRTLAPFFPGPRVAAAGPATVAGSLNELVPHQGHRRDAGRRAR
ncbi:hypothetical protein CBM2631_A70003 [Cupriavidus taiwanensis]|nr:hypothetical protein CBM2622_A50003 [Cupriavidus taiwanensis]SPA15834.1 hypothetical protein CBM2631_A70003 [Cupriavidus taiwanensis]